MNFEEHLLTYLTKDEIDKLVTSLNSESKHALLLNTSKISKEDFLNLFPNITKHPLVENGYYYDKEEYPFGKTYMHDAGTYYLQEPSAMIVSSLLNPTKEDIVLDMCAAPGGKTVQAALLMDNKGILIANDLSYSRAKILSSNVERMGLSNVVVTSMDLHNLPKNYDNCFTKIILDAPCSGSGMFRKDEKMVEDWTYEKVLKCAEIQKDLIVLAFNLLAPGGTLVYSTCSFSYEEDEDVVKYLLDNCSNASLVNMPENNYFYYSKEHIGIHLMPSTFEGEGHYICLINKEDDNSINHSLPLLKKYYSNKNYNSFIDRFQLNDLYLYQVNESLYGLTTPLDLKGLTVLRAGVKLLEDVKGIITPDYALSHYLTSNNSITLNDDEAKKYIHGETINKDLTNGFYVVSYQNVNLGFVKAVNGTLKNYYPKGLRH